jgi:hypothetical protein
VLRVTGGGAATCLTGDGRIDVGSSPSSSGASFGSFAASVCLASDGTALPNRTDRATPLPAQWDAALLVLLFELTSVERVSDRFSPASAVAPRAAASGGRSPVGEGAWRSSFGSDASISSINASSRLPGAGRLGATFEARDGLGPDMRHGTASDVPRRLGGGGEGDRVQYR